MSANNGVLDPRTVYVQNINFKTTAENLGKAFEKFGKITACRILHDKIYGLEFSRGKGFVEFEEPESVEKAINDKNIKIDGRTLSVSQARKKYGRKNDTAFISGIPQGTKEEDILNEFKDYNATDALVVFEDANGFRGGYAFVKFESTEKRNKAIEEKKTFSLKGEESHLSIARRDFDETN